MILSNDFIEGIFLNETKNRFLCEVMINDKIYECYIPSSSRLDHYLKLKNKKVLLTQNKGTNLRTSYSIFSVQYYNKHILLNLNLANKLLEEELTLIIDEDSTILKEKVIAGYKTDLLLQGKEQIIIEVKSILSTKHVTIFPSMHSERAVEQLKKIYNLLSNGKSIHYYFVSLSPFTKKVIISNTYKEFYNYFIKCIDEGMIVTGLGISSTANEIKLNRKIQICID